jgi:hypothetical protein
MVENMIRSCVCVPWSFLLGVSKKPPAKEIEINLMIYGGCNISEVYKFSKFIYKSFHLKKKPKKSKYQKLHTKIQRKKCPRHSSIDCLV